MDTLMEEYRVELIKMITETLKMNEILRSTEQTQVIEDLKLLLIKLTAEGEKKKNSASSEKINASKNDIVNNAESIVSSTTSSANETYDLNMLDIPTPKNRNLSSSSNISTVSSAADYRLPNSPMLPVTNDFVAHVKRAQEISVQKPSVSLQKMTKCKYCKQLFGSNFINLHIQNKHSGAAKKDKAATFLNKVTNFSPSKIPTSPLKCSTKFTVAMETATKGLSQVEKITKNLNFLPKNNSLINGNASTSNSDAANSVVAKNNTNVVHYVSMITCTICNKTVRKVRFAYHMQKFHAVHEPNSANKIEQKRISVIDIANEADFPTAKRETRYVRCKYCRQMCKYPLYTKHLREAHNGKGCRFRCISCNTRFLTPKACKQHMTMARHLSGMIKLEA